MHCQSLGPLDHNAPRNIPQSMIYLSLKHGCEPSHAFARLREGLRRTLQRLPWLGGKIHLQSPDSPGWRPGALEIRYADKNEALDLLRMKELKTPRTYANLRDAGFPPDTFDDEEIIWTRPWSPDFHEGVPVFSAQANFLPGGCLLAVSVPSSASDGTAMLMTIKLWADFCSKGAILAVELGATTHQSASNDNNIDRSILDKLLLNDMTRDSPSENRSGIVSLHHLVGMGAIPDKVNQSSENDMRQIIFYMPHTAYTALWKDCIGQYGDANVTGNDLISALIWRSLMRARAATKTQEPGDNASVMTTLLRPFDARPNLTKVLSTAYLGNLNFENRIMMPLGSLVNPRTSIPTVAHAISEGVALQNTQSNLIEAYMLLRSVPDYGHAEWGATHASGTTVGVLSPIVLPFNDTCFGADVFGNGGRPDAFRPVMGTSNRSFRTNFVIPRKQHGGLEFIMTVSSDELIFLCEDEEFSEYAFPL